MSDPMGDFLIRLVDLLKEDEELHAALIANIESSTQANLALAEYRRKRSQ